MLRMLSLALMIVILITCNSPLGDCSTFEFIPNTNLLQSTGWKSSPCLKKRMVMENGDPVALMIDLNWEFEDVIFPSDSAVELIFGEDGVGFASQASDFDQSSCSDETAFTYKPNPEVPAWHSPLVWKFLNASIEPNHRIRLHAESIPGQYDTAYFNPANSHRVYIDAPARAGRLITGGFSHTTETFLTHVETVEGNMQFKLEDDLDPDDIIDDIILESNPPVGVYGKDCEDKTGCTSYNLNSKIMSQICTRATDCFTAANIPCTSPVRPLGHCCDICGGMIKFQASTDYDYSSLLVVINASMHHFAPEGRFSLMKVGDWEYQLVLVKGSVDSGFDPTWTKEKIEVMNGVLLEASDLGIVADTVSMVYALERTPYDKVALGLSLTCIICLLIGVGVVASRRRDTIANWFVGRRIQLRALWRDDQGDRIHLEMADPQAQSSDASSSRASMTSFENPSFKHLLAQEEDKATMAAVYEHKKAPALSYDDKSGITFTNPLFESGAKGESRAEE